MADRPILFSAPMVRAILDGRKTQTRRIWQMPKGHRWDDQDAGLLIYEGNERPYGIDELKCGYAVGDRLWVRETWKTSTAYDAVAPRDLPKGAQIYFTAQDNLWPVARYRPSMFMPRWASRITLIVEDVRVQRLQDISEAGAIAEGVERTNDSAYFPTYRDYLSLPKSGEGALPLARDAFRTLWDSLNAARAPWESNPWCCAINFAAVKKNIDEVAG